MIEIIYGDAKYTNEIYLEERTENFFNLFITRGFGKTAPIFIDNSLVKLSKKEIEWIILNTKRPVKIVLKDKHINFTKTALKPFETKNKYTKKIKITLIDNIEKEPSIWKFLDRIVFDEDRKKLYQDMLETKPNLVMVVRQMLYFPDRLGNENIMNLLDMMLFKSNKHFYEILCFGFKPLKAGKYIGWWDRKYEV